MKRTILALLFALTLTSPALAGGKHTKHSHTAPAAADLITTLAQSLELSAGWRWQSEANATGDLSVHDPFYVGAALRLPLAQRVSLFGAFDRDFTDAPLWQARTGVAFTPFSR